jgi:hypothetical protein
MFSIFTYEAAGASDARLSLRPLMGEIYAGLGQITLRERKDVSEWFSSFRGAPLGASPESIAPQSLWKNGFRACAFRAK